MTIEQGPGRRNFDSDAKFLNELKAQVPEELRNEKLITILGFVVHEHLIKNTVSVEIDRANQWP